MSLKERNWSPIGQGDFDGGLAHLESELEDGYIVRFGLQKNDDGVLECLSFSISWPENATHPSNSITSRTFQLIGFGNLLASARKAYPIYYEIVVDTLNEMEVDRILSEWTSYGPIQIPDLNYAALAWKYEKFINLGLNQPIAELSKFMNCDRATISTRVAEARNRGVLSKPKRGSFGGQLTAKGKKALGITEKKLSKGKKA